jgi:hypothetical protein
MEPDLPDLRIDPMEGLNGPFPFTYEIPSEQVLDVEVLERTLREFYELGNYYWTQQPEGDILVYANTDTHPNLTEELRVQGAVKRPEHALKLAQARARWLYGDYRLRTSLESDKLLCPYSSQDRAAKQRTAYKWRKRGYNLREMKNREIVSAVPCEPDTMVVEQQNLSLKLDQTQRLSIGPSKNKVEVHPRLDTDCTGSPKTGESETRESETRESETRESE